MSEELPVWYATGLSFECTQCGQCCTGAPGNVWVNDDEIEAIANHLDKPVGEIRLLYARPSRGGVSLKEFENGDCVFLDPKTRGCTVYPVRPRQCRTWPFWNSNISSAESWRQTCEVCPGAGTGKLFEIEAIQKQAAVIDI